MRKRLIVLLLIAICFSLLTGCGTESKEDERTIAEMSEEEQGETLKHLYDTTDDISFPLDCATNWFEDDIEKQNYWTNKVWEWYMADSDKDRFGYVEIPESVSASMNYVETPKTGLDALEIQSDLSKWTVDGDYSYYNGSVKNVGDKPIYYYEITIEYKDDDGNVLDSDYTNSAQTLNPNDMRIFEIMHPHSSRFTKAYVYVTKVEFE